MPLKALTYYLQAEYKHEQMQKHERRQNELNFQLYVTDMLREILYVSAVHKFKNPKRSDRYWDLINPDKQKKRAVKKDITPQNVINMFMAGGKMKLRKF